ncbi:MAG: hypothetical protein FOGNACKC_03813 [Anaerolineae bacterium]|nr:hypothetical protein [Anaerolineae bacterium]
MLQDLKISVPNINQREQVPEAAIEAVAAFIARSFNPEKIILFGSYAYGQPKPWSDVDLLVVIETDNPKQTQMDINLSFLHPFGLDILVRTPQEINERVKLGDAFLREAVTRGKILYERAGA